MGRPHRFDPRGGWHHVMNRGAARQTVFHTDDQREKFEALLDEGHHRHGVEIHAYCLMTNHYHLLLHCPDGRLSEFMHHLSSQYTRLVNADLGRDGPLFRGRFRSLPIDSERYLATVGRYIHRNPLDIRPPVRLSDYRWSSLRHYGNPSDAPAWLEMDVLSSGWDSPEDYCIFVGSDLAAAASSVAWSIAAALAEQDDDGLAERANVERTVALRMTEIGPSALAASVERWLSFPSLEARRAARRRARLRLADQPALEAVARRAVELATAGSLAPSVVSEGARHLSTG